MICLIEIKIEVLSHIVVQNILFRFTCFKFYKLDSYR